MKYFKKIITKILYINFINNSTKFVALYATYISFKFARATSRG